MFKVHKRYWNLRVSNASNGKIILLSKLKNVEVKNQDSLNQEAKGLLSNLGIRTPLSKMYLLGDILF